MISALRVLRSPAVAIVTRGRCEVGLRQELRLEPRSQTICEATQLSQRRTLGREVRFIRCALRVVMCRDSSMSCHSGQGTFADE
jgi:hypothetical protein